MKQKELEEKYRFPFCREEGFYKNAQKSKEGETGSIGCTLKIKLYVGKMAQVQCEEQSAHVCQWVW